jgi:hypothetical protein
LTKTLVIATLVIGGAYVAYQKDYLQLQSTTDSARAWLSGKTQSLTDKETEVFKIQNPDGSWTFTNKKPEGQDNVEVQTYRNDANVLPPIEASPADKPSNAQKIPPADPQIIGDKIDSVHAVQKAARQHRDRTQRAIDNP